MNRNIVYLLASIFVGNLLLASCKPKNGKFTDINERFRYQIAPAGDGIILVDKVTGVMILTSDKSAGISLESSNISAGIGKMKFSNFTITAKIAEGIDATVIDDDADLSWDKMAIRKDGKFKSLISSKDNSEDGFPRSLVWSPSAPASK